jgi:dimeric dUTPase (all-alpha-NTP-PPase superfamily)
MQAKLDKYILINHELAEVDTYERRIIAFLVELGELANETRCFKYWSTKMPSERNVILEEYVDGIHFLISLGNTLRIELTEEMFVAHQQELDVNKQFIELFVSISNLSSNVKVDHYNLVFNQYINLGYSLGFDLDEIYQGYLEKNKVNYERQESNY